MDINENLKKQRELTAKLLTSPLEGEPLELLDVGIEVASIIAYRVPRSESIEGPESPRYEGWVWSAGTEPSEKLPFKLPRVNTCNHPVADLEVAKAKCKAWVKRKLEEARESSSVQNSTVDDVELTG